jgi:hypothetical protein
VAVERSVNKDLLQRKSDIEYQLMEALARLPVALAEAARLSLTRGGTHACSSHNDESPNTRHSVQGRSSPHSSRGARPCAPSRASREDLDRAKAGQDTPMRHMSEAAHMPEPSAPQERATSWHHPSAEPVQPQSAECVSGSGLNKLLFAEESPAALLSSPGNLSHSAPVVKGSQNRMHGFAEGGSSAVDSFQPSSPIPRDATSLLQDEHARNPPDEGQAGSQPDRKGISSMVRFGTTHHGTGSVLGSGDASVVGSEAGSAHCFDASRLVEGDSLTVKQDKIPERAWRGGCLAAVDCSEMHNEARSQDGAQSM